jgi:hypothetical protein
LVPSASPSAYLALTYGYGTTTNNGNVLSQSINAGGTVFSQSYTYDDINRLKTFTESSTAQTYCYDRGSGDGALNLEIDQTRLDRKPAPPTRTRKFPRIPANPIPTTTSRPCSPGARKPDIGSREPEAGSRIPPPLQSTRTHIQAHAFRPHASRPASFRSECVSGAQRHHIEPGGRLAKESPGRKAGETTASRQRDRGARPRLAVRLLVCRAGTTVTRTDTALENRFVCRTLATDLARQRPTSPLASLAP